MNSSRQRAGSTARGLLVVTAAALALAGCGDDGDTPPADEPSSTVEGTQSPAAPDDSAGASQEPAPLAIKSVPAGHGLSMLVADSAGDGTQGRNGKIIVADRGCLHLTRRAGPPTLLVLPPGSELDAARRPTLVVGAARYPVGTPVRVTGESLTLDADQASAAAPCVARGPVLRVDAIS